MDFTAPMRDCDFDCDGFAGGPYQLRDEFLERVEFESVADAREKAAWYRREYNAIRPHSSLKYATPKEFSAACDKKGINQRTKVRKPVSM